MEFCAMNNIGPFPRRSELHLSRKVWHMGLGALGLILYFYVDRVGAHEVMVFSVVAGTLGLALDFFRLRVASLNQGFIKIFRPLLREEEKENFCGLSFYAFGVALSLFFFNEQIALLGIMFLVVADPLSSFFGILFGKKKILPHKSLEGTLACFLVCMGITLLYGSHYVPVGGSLILFSLFAGIIGALSELASFLANDNFTIPVGSSLGVWFLNHFFSNFVMGFGLRVAGHKASGGRLFTTSTSIPSLDSSI